MAIYFPQEVPIKWFEWNDRVTVAQDYSRQIADFRGDFMGQFSDATYDNHRILLLDSSFAAAGELTGGEISIDSIDNKNVYTFTADWGDYFANGDVAYFAVVDANTNKQLQNFLPNGDFANTDNWTLDSGLTISAGSLRYNDVTQAEAVYDLPIKIGAEYTITATFTSSGDRVEVSLKNGGDVEATVNSDETTTLTATFTADDAQFSIDFNPTGTGSVFVSEVEISMTFSDLIPEWVSAPFCVTDAQAGTLTIHGCANNDYFNMYFESTGFVPRVLVPAEIREFQAEQDIESYFSTTGKPINYFVQHVSQRQLRVDWIPDYLLNFFQVVFYLDSAQIENTEYVAVETPEIGTDDNNPQEIIVTSAVALKQDSVGFKRIINNPDSASCTVPSGAYESQNDGSEYLQQGTNEVYYPQ